MIGSYQPAFFDAVAKVLRGMAFDWIVGAAAVVVALSVQAQLLGNFEINPEMQGICFHLFPLSVG